MIKENIYQLLLVQDLIDNHFLLCGCLPDDVREALSVVSGLCQSHLDEIEERGELND